MRGVAYSVRIIFRSIKRRFLIDAIVSGCFSDEIGDMTAEEEIEWAKEKIGKYLFFDDFIAVSYVAIA